MSSWDQGVASTSMKKKCRGVRRRKWGKWVSEIRVPGTKDRLWLGSFSTCEAAGVAHDVASYCLRGPSSLTSLNFPAMLPAAVSVTTTATAMSPTSVQKAASEAGMAVDAQLIVANAPPMPTTAPRHLRPPFGIQTLENEAASSTQTQPLDISVDDYL